MVKRLPAMQETRVLSLGQEDPLEKEMATHSSTLAWWATVHGVAKSRTRLSDFTFFHFSTLYSQMMNSQMILKIKQILNPLLTIFFL